GRIAPHDKVKVYVQKAEGFGLPADPSTPIIMIGPGTGIAPFRAFLHERMATKAPGRNWLFFGHQRSNYDFFYEDELSGMSSAGCAPRARRSARPSALPDACSIRCFAARTGRWRGSDGRPRSKASQPAYARSSIATDPMPSRSICPANC